MMIRGLRWVCASVVVAGALTLGFGAVAFAQDAAPAAEETKDPAALSPLETPQQDPALHNIELARVHIRFKHPELAVAELERAEKIAKNDIVKATLYWWWSVAVVLDKDYARAEKIFEKAQSFCANPNQKSLLAINFARLLAGQGKTDIAAKYFDFVSDNATLYQDRVRAATEKYAFIKRAGKLDDLVKKVEADYKANPKNVQAVRAIYEIYTLATPNTDKAIEYGTKLAELDPKDGDVLRQLAAIYTQLKQPEKAVTAYQRLLTIEPGLRNSVLLSISTAYTQAGKHAEASEYAKNLVKVDQQSCVAWQRMGECYANVGNTAAAIECLQKAQKLGKNAQEKERVSLVYGDVLLAAKRLPEAKNVYFQLSREASTPQIRDLAKRRLFFLYGQMGELEKVKMEAPQ